MKPILEQRVEQRTAAGRHQDEQGARPLAPDQVHHGDKRGRGVHDLVAEIGDGQRDTLTGFGIVCLHPLETPMVNRGTLPCVMIESAS